MSKRPSKPKRRKNPAAIALAKRQLETASPTVRSERARKAVLARWRKHRGEAVPNAPVRYWGLFYVEDLANRKLLDWDRDKLALRARLLERGDWPPCVIEELDYDPGRLIVKNVFQGDVAAQVKALRILAGEEREK